MLTINANTKIAALLKAHPDALEAIISISPKFNKLKNPLLRKLMASRTSISMASKVAGCTVQHFFDALQPLGFIIDKKVVAEKNQPQEKKPGFMSALSEKHVVELDVRPVIDSGKDPFKIITGKIKELEAGAVLKLINSFEPTPLIALLSKQGFSYYVDATNEDLVTTWFLKPETPVAVSAPEKQTDGDWDSLLEKFSDKLVSVDVREMEMPQPMMTILDGLDHLPVDHALYVYHKRIPVFLLPELQERKFDYRIKKVSDGEVYLLIFKP